MLANNVISSVPNTSDGGYDPADPNVWANTKCWHFTPGSYILQENLAYAQLIPATDYTIGGWFKIMYNGDMNSNYDLNYRRAIYAMFNGDSTNSNSIMYGSIIEDKRQPENGGTIKLVTHNENSYPFSGHQFSENYGAVNSWQLLMMRVKTSASDDNAAWFTQGEYRSSNMRDYTQNPDEGNYAIRIGGEDIEFYVSELGVWKDNLPATAITSLYNNGTPVSFQENIGNYADANGKDKLVAYYRFGDGTNDNPASFLHDETNTDNSSTATDLNSMYGTIYEVPLQNAN